MHTRARAILDVSRQLFNERGEYAVSSLDIANTLEISPGNLYYHYRGKTEIVDALFTEYLAAGKAWLNACESIPAKAAAAQLMAEQQQYQFLLQQGASLFHHYPKLATPMNQHLRALIAKLAMLCGREHTDPLVATVVCYPHSLANQTQDNPSPFAMLSQELWLDCLFAKAHHSTSSSANTTPLQNHSTTRNSTTHNSAA